MAKATKYGVVLRRGLRYRYKDKLYLRDVPQLVTKEVRDHLVEEAGFFVDILLDANGKPPAPKRRARPRRRARSGVTVHAGPPLMDTASAPIPSIEANAEGAEEV